MGTVILFIVVLSLLVFVHELGHFWTAKKMGMDVEEFGFGFPPRAWGKKVGDTLYSINWLPLGGFVKIKGEDGSHRDESTSFASKKPWQRIVVLSAGVIMNFLTAAVLLAIGFMFGLPQALDGIEDGYVSNPRIQVIEVVEGSAAAQAELTTGDTIVSLNGMLITSAQQLIDQADQLVGQTGTFEIARGTEVMTKEIPIDVLEQTGKGGIGVSLIGTGIVQYPWYLSLWKGIEAAGLITWQIVIGFAGLIAALVSGQGVGVAVSGPVGIAVMTGQVAQLGFTYLLQFTALLSLNLAVINFLPFPALDGGRVIFVLIEKLRGKPVNQKIEGWFHASGFALLMILILVVTFQDVIRLVQ